MAIAISNLPLTICYLYLARIYSKEQHVYFMGELLIQHRIWISINFLYYFEQQSLGYPTVVLYCSHPACLYLYPLKFITIFPLSIYILYH